MKRTILLFFILNILLFSSNDFITSNGKISFKYNEKYNKITRLNGDMEVYKTDIDSIEVGVYYKGDYYLLSDYITSKNFIPRTNMFESVATLPFGKVKTIYIPSMIDKKNFYIINNYQLKKEEPLEFLYFFNMSDRNGTVEYNKTKDYYKYNKNIYIKNLKNKMEGYIIPVSDLEGFKLKKIQDYSIKYRDQRLVMSSQMKLLDRENSDIVQIRYKGIPEYLSFESSKRLISLEKKYWKKWLQPITLTIDSKTKKIIERFLIYLKTSTDGSNYYTNIGLRETSLKRDILYTAMVFIKYGYFEDAKQIVTRLIKKETEISYLNNMRLTIKEVQEGYIYLTYLKKSDDIKFLSKNRKKIESKIDKIVQSIEKDLNKKNVLEKGYEFKIYYYTYNILKSYRETSKNKKYVYMEERLKSFLSMNFILDDGIKKYISDREITYSKWEYLFFYSDLETKKLVDKLYNGSVFNRYSYFSFEKDIDVEKNLSLIGGLYLNNLSKYGDMNLLQINEDISKNSMKIPSKIYLIGERKYKDSGIDIYLTSKYLNTVYDRSEE